MASEMGDILQLLSLTTAEINAISTPNEGGLVYNSTLNEVQEYNGTSWISGGGGTAEAQPIVSLSSTDVSTSVNQASASVLSWDIETYKDSGFTHDNVTNNSRIEVVADVTYEIEANIRMESA